MIDIDVTSNIKAVSRKLTRIEKKQIPYAVMVALTRTAKDSQARIIDEIPRRFNVTKKWWLPRQPTGIKVNIAKKTRLLADVYTNAYFLPLHETGGVKFPRQGKGILIPTSRTPKYGRKSNGAARVLAGKKILKRGGVSGGYPIMTMDSGKKGVFRRRGKRRFPIDILYGYRPSVVIDKRLGFADTAQSEAKAQFNKHFTQVLSTALARG